VIQVEMLGKRYGEIDAIRNVTFQVERGEIVGFLGPNGAGKTTTMKILTGFMPPSSGRALIFGFDVLDHPLEAKERIGYLPENVPLYPVMTVDRFLHFVGAAKGLPRRTRSGEVDRVVEACSLGEVRKRIISHLSKGFRQRVGLAQALLGNPPLLIFDEPTIGLDPAQIVEIRNLILSLKHHHTVLLSSHILPEVSQVCERVIIINKGQIVATDTPENLTRRTRGNNQIRVQVSAPAEQVTPVLMSVLGVQSVVPDKVPETFIVTAAPETEVRPMVARALTDQGWDLMEIHRIAVSLEEIFVQIVTEEQGESA